MPIMAIRMDTPLLKAGGVLPAAQGDASVATERRNAVATLAIADI